MRREVVQLHVPAMFQNSHDAQKDVSSSIYVLVTFYNSLMNKDTIYH